MSRSALCLAVALFGACLAGCGVAADKPMTAGIIAHPAGHQPRPWTHLRFDNNPDHFQFAIVGDRTGQHRPGVFEKGLEKLNLLRPEFVMSVGDLIEGYTKDEAEIDQQWDEIEGFTGRLDAPFFYVAGNHDMANPAQAKKWRERFGPAYYHFVYRDVLFLCLNTYDPESRLSSEQIAYVERALRANPNVRWTCVFMHEPLWDYKKKENGWPEVEKLLAHRPYTVFAGHYHAYTKYVRNDRRYFVLATTGGGMKKGPLGPELGAFDHVTWVTMMPQGPRIANLALDGIHDEDIRTEVAATLINRVLNGNVLQVSPVHTTHGTFERAKATLTFQNDAEVPMTVRASIPPRGALRVTPETIETTVPAGSQKTVGVELIAQSPTPVSEVDPLAVKWTATFEPPGQPAVRVPREDVVAVEQIATIPVRAKPVVIDGNLEEWTSFPHAYEPTAATKPPQWGGPSDCSYQFAIEHDDEYLYVAVKTIDDRAILNPLKEPWSQDGVEIRLDARPEPDRSQGRGRGEMKDILVVSMSPGETPDQMVLYSADQLPAGVKAVCVKTPTGHAAEVAVPASYLDQKQGGPWKALRLNIAVDDFDKPAGPLRALWWRPDWRSGATYSGSGTFQRKQ